MLAINDSDRALRLCERAIGLTESPDPSFLQTAVLACLRAKQTDKGIRFLADIPRVRGFSIAADLYLDALLEHQRGRVEIALRLMSQAREASSLTPNERSMLRLKVEAESVITPAQSTAEWRWIEAGPG